MAGLDKFLIDNPEMKDEDPNDIADFVYETQMQGVDRNEFNEFFLGKTPERGFLGKAYDYVKDAYQGDAEFPDVKGVLGSGYDSVGTRAAAMFGNDEDILNSVLKNNPGAMRAEDKNGNPMIIGPEGIRYVNPPGLDADDVIRGVGKAAMFYPAGAATTAVAAAGKGLLARMAVGGVTAGLTDAAMQKGAGRENIDPLQVATTAALGAGAEGASHAVSGALRWAKGKYNARWNSIPAKRRGQILARKMDIDNLTGAQYERLGKLDDLDMSDDAKMADALFGLKQTRGQAMPTTTSKQRAARTKQLNKEEALSQTSGGQSIKDHIDDNYKALAEGPGKLADRFSGGERIGRGLNESAEVVKREIVAKKAELESGFKAMYDSAAKHDVEYMNAAVQRVPSYLNKVVEADPRIFLSNTATGTPKTVEALKYIDDHIKKYTQNSNPNDKSVFTITLNQMEHLRKKLNALRNQTSKLDGGEDRYALDVVRKELMGVVDRIGDASLFKGDVAGIKKQKAANKLFSEYAKQFRDPKGAGKKIQEIVDDGIQPDQVAKVLFGANGMGNKEAMQLAKAYGRIVGKESEGYKALKETYFYANTLGRDAETKGPAGLIGSIKRILYNDGASTVKELYTKSEVANMKQFVRSIEIAMDLRKTSGTAERGMRMLDTILSRSIPGPLTWIVQGIKNVASAPIQAAKAASITRIPKKVGPLPILPSTLPAVGAASNQ